MWRRNFTAPGLFVIATLLLGVALFFGLLKAIELNAASVRVRAITAAEHAQCADMPRGSQEMEDRRYDCFTELYKGSWKRVD